MPLQTKPKNWVANVVYESVEYGDIDVDYGIDELSHLHTLITQGVGYASVRQIKVERHPDYTDDIIAVEKLAKSR